MTEFTIQGTLSITGTTLLTGGSEGSPYLSRILNMRFNNPLAYVFELYKYEAATSTTILIYSLSLAGGDTVTDSLTYILNAGDQLIAYSDIVGTTYYANGIQ